MSLLNIPLDLILGLGIGLSLGLIGGGGSILTVPALVYLVGQSPQTAVTTSLAIVGINSLSGAFFHQQKTKINWRVALLFGVTGMTTAYFGADLSASIPSEILLVLFAALMTFVAAHMLLASRKPIPEPSNPRSLAVILAAGIGVGLLTGFFGVGGGFLIVPALVILVGLPMSQAIGTSLVIITLNSLAGFIGHIQYAACDIPVLVIFTLAGSIGVFLGARFCHKLSGNTLRLYFAGFVLLLAIYLLWDNLPKLVNL